jgi:hypothetical protein
MDNTMESSIFSNNLVDTSTNISTTSSPFSFIKSISLTSWLLIILILAVLGFNIFVFLAKGTQDISDILRKILGVFGIASSKLVDVSATGAKAVVNTTADVLDTGLTDIQNALPQGQISQSSIHTTTVQNSIPQPNTSMNNSLNRALNTSQASQQHNQTYQEDEASSSIQSKTGYCYIGDDRGYRSCAYVGVNDSCMSGEIFPTNEICVNPNLRP